MIGCELAQCDLLLPLLTAGQTIIGCKAVKLIFCGFDGISTIRSDARIASFESGSSMRSGLLFISLVNTLGPSHNPVLWC